MADNEAAEGAESTEAVPAPKGKLKLIIAVVGMLVIFGGGAATWFLFFRHGGDEAHAEAPPSKPPVFVEVPDMLVNLVGMRHLADLVSKRMKPGAAIASISRNQ